MSTIVPRQNPAVSGSAEPTSVYRYYDEHGVLIYVGITRQGTGRNLQHSRRAEWWQYVVRQELEHYATRSEAAEREKSLIHEFRPPFNRQHNTDADVLRAAYVAIAEGLRDTRSPMDIFRSYGHAIPVVAMAPMSHSRIAFRTEPVDVRLSARVEIETPLRVLAAGTYKGSITTLRRQGDLLVLRCELKRGAQHYERGLLRLKLDTKGRKFPATFLDLGAQA